MVIKLHVVAFWIVMLGSDAVGYQYFRGPCCHALWSSISDVETCL